MKNILIIAQKGGVGKSTVSDEIAFSLDRTGVPYNFYDLDSQGGTIHKTEHSDDAKVSVIDTPPGLNKDIPNWLKEADLIVIPTGTTFRDLEPLKRMKALIDEHAPKAKVLYILNRWTRYTSSNQFEQWFNGSVSNNNVCKIPLSEQFPQSGAYKESVLARRKNTNAAISTLEMVNKVREFVGLPKE